MNFNFFYYIISSSVAEIAIIYNPVLKQLFTARRGQGAFFNGERMQASGKKELREALVVAEFGTARDAAKLEIAMENMKVILESCQG